MRLGPAGRRRDCLPQSPETLSFFFVLEEASD